jgi:hypothetical protein
MTIPAKLLYDTEARFLANVAPPDENGCHLWTARTDRGGYGQFWCAVRYVRAHRYAAGMVDWPPEIQTRHLCNVPACVNPEHLTFGSHADNMRDMVEADRQAKGTDNGSAKLTEEQVLDIRRRYAEGGVTQRSLAAEYGVARSLICNIVRRKIWAYLDDDPTAPAGPTLLERLDLSGPDHGVSDITIIASVIADAKGRAA